MIKKILVPLFIFLSFIQLHSEKQEIQAESIFKNQVPKLMKVSWENDLFFQSDREYTNGVKIEYGEYQFLHTPSSWLLGGLSLLSKKFHLKIKNIQV